MREEFEAKITELTTAKNEAELDAKESKSQLTSVEARSKD